MRFTTTPIAAVHLTFNTQTAFFHTEGSTYLRNISTHTYNTAYKLKRARSTVSMFPYFHHGSSPCVHNIAASCSSITATYCCNQHTNFQTPQPHKHFKIQTVTTDSLHFPCTHSNQLLSLQSLYTAHLTTSQQHTF